MLVGLTFVSLTLTGDSKLYYSLSYWFVLVHIFRNCVIKTLAFCVAGVWWSGRSKGAHCSTGGPAIWLMLATCDDRS